MTFKIVANQFSNNRLSSSRSVVIKYQKMEAPVCQIFVAWFFFAVMMVCLKCDYFCWRTVPWTLEPEDMEWLSRPAVSNANQLWLNLIPHYWKSNPMSPPAYTPGTARFSDIMLRLQRFEPQSSFPRWPVAVDWLSAWRDSLWEEIKFNYFCWKAAMVSSGLVKYIFFKVTKKVLSV